MRISDSPAATAAESVNSATAAPQSSKEASVSGTPQDDVSITSVAQAVTNAIDAPESKIQELRAKYLDGSYRVDSGELSSKIIDEHLGE